MQRIVSNLSAQRNVVVVAVAALIRNADLDPESKDVVALALEFILDVEVIVANALLVDIPEGEGLRTADVRAMAATPAVLNALLAVNEDGSLDDVVQGIPDIDLDDDLGILVVLIELNDERAEGVIVELQGTSNSDLEIMLDVGVVVALAVLALLVAGIVAQLLQSVRVRALAKDNHLSALASNINLLAVVVVGSLVLMAVRP
jgi:hypothetical protein